MRQEQEQEQRLQPWTESWAEAWRLQQRGLKLLSQGICGLFSRCCSLRDRENPRTLAKVKYCNMLRVLTRALGVVAGQGDEVEFEGTAGGQLAGGVRGAAGA